MQLTSFLGIPFIIDGQLLGAAAMANTSQTAAATSGGYTAADIERCNPLAEIGGLLIAANRR